LDQHTWSTNWIRIGQHAELGVRICSMMDREVRNADQAGKATNSRPSIRQSTMQNPSLHAGQEQNPSAAIPIQL
jgi:hypothetical protein